MIIAGQRLLILIATKPVDFRCGHNALALIVQTELKLDPHSGVTVVFRSKRGDRLKILLWDGTGLVLTYKVLEQGSFAWPKVQDGVMRLSRAQFEALFEGLDVTSRQVVWLFFEQPRLEFVPFLHRFQGRLAAQG